MAGRTEIEALRQGRRWVIASAAGVAGLMALSIVVLEATDERRHLLLTRNDVSAAPAGARTWRGGLTNMTAAALEGLTVEIRFLDEQGAIVGRLEAQTSRLAAGADFELETAVPPGATALQVHGLAWRAAGQSVELGPSGPWSFGRIQA